MASEKEIEQRAKLIAYLDSLEFKGSKLEKDLRKNMALSLPSFKIDHRMEYGAETMFFELNFKKDHQKGGYRLSSYKATHRTEVFIDHQEINGINTADLDERMAGWKWDLYFKDPDKLLNEQGKIFMKETFEQLHKITEEDNHIGAGIQQKLMFKHWPKQYVDQQIYQQLLPIYEHNREFSVSEFGCCNAHLAYHILSGRLDDLYEKIRETGIDQYPGVDLYRLLEQELSQNPEQFQIQKYHNTWQYQAEFILPVASKENWYHIDTYKAILTPLPEIAHANIKGIDTCELEESMRAVAWHRDRELFEFSNDGEPVFLDYINNIQRQMNILYDDPAGAVIADQLSLKYWIDATFFEDLIRPQAWDYLDSLPKRMMEFPVSVDAKVACNLLLGKSVAEKFLLSEAATPGNWVRLKLDKLEDPGTYHYIHTTGPTAEQIDKLLVMLPMIKWKHNHAVNELQKGELIQGSTISGKKILIEVDPESKSLNFYSNKMEPIPVNIQFDPDWKPPGSRLEKKINAPEIPSQNSKIAGSKNKKGPRL
ncbi:hypothetical protein AB6805_13870 [Chitinophaga sp. RCC_12]|uniref:hypothetical protein n=1 Tax=Chitinophaga sp. RCC_12 TaxID=3239226 RepID=UPI0035266DF5